MLVGCCRQARIKHHIWQVVLCHLDSCSLETIIGKLPYSQETITDCLEDLHNEEKITYKLKGQSRYWYPENI